MLKIVLIATSLDYGRSVFKEICDRPPDEVLNTRFWYKDGTRFILVSENDSQSLVTHTDADQIIVTGPVTKVSNYVMNNLVQRSCVPKEFKIQWVD